MDIVLIGFGNVGRGLVEILHEKGPQLRADYGLEVRLLGVATRSRGTLYDPDGLDTGALLEAASAQRSLNAYPDSPTLRRDRDAAHLAGASPATVMVEASPTDLQTGGAALELTQAALGSGKHVILASKGPVALAYNELRMLAQRSGVRLLLEATVMAGTPAIRTLTDTLAGCTIQRVRGILNGTTNYILTEMENGMTYTDALNQAQRLGYAERDPSGDVGGWDAAAKAMILGAVLYNAGWTLSDLNVEGIIGITRDNVAAALGDGTRYKLIAEVTPDGASVGPMRLPMTDPLAAINGATNAITYSTDLLGDVTLIGPGAGPRETGFALLADLLAIHRDG
ncbi:MAG: homoserine dehydrogenase [Chloroflexota bacterium]